MKKQKMYYFYPDRRKSYMYENRKSKQKAIEKVCNVVDVDNIDTGTLHQIAESGYNYSHYRHYRRYRGCNNRNIETAILKKIENFYNKKI